jgi:predicted NBD/HSP70 family sugar kinase
MQLGMIGLGHMAPTWSTACSSRSRAGCSELLAQDQILERELAVAADEEGEEAEQME